MAVFAPQTEDELADCIVEANQNGRTLGLRGGGSKSAIGAPPPPETDIVDLRALSGIIAYEPNELVLTARAATPLDEIEQALTEHGQMLAFDPHNGAGQATLGGVIAAAVSGPRRVSAGAARDHVLGFKAVSGRGERFIAGGKVVKNVTGYDLPKLMAGSWGRLAALTTITVKVLPKPKTERTLVCEGSPRAEAVTLMSAAMRSRAVVSCAAHSAKDGRTMLRIEGSAGVDARMQTLRTELAPSASVQVLGESDSAALWSTVRDGAVLANADILWRVVCAPSRMSGLIDTLAIDDNAWDLDWAGGLASISGYEDANRLRDIVSSAGGHATLVRAPEPMRRIVPAFHPQSRALEALSARVRRAFDPNGVFETGRFTGCGHAD